MCRPGVQEGEPVRCHEMDTNARAAGYAELRTGDAPMAAPEGALTPSRFAVVWNNWRAGGCSCVYARVVHRALWLSLRASVGIRLTQLCSRAAE